MRDDFYLYNDGGAWSVVVVDTVADIIEDERQHDEQFVLANKAALFAIEGDDYSVIRLVLNEPLTEQESSEWIARARWRLKVDGEQVLVCGGFDPDCLADWQEQGDGGDIKSIQLPAGDYQVVLYSYLHSMNGAIWASSSVHEGSLPELTAWFRKDHPNTSIPTWLAALFAYDDVNEENEWYPLQEAVKTGRVCIAEQPLHWISYLVHLIPFTDEMELDLPGSDGWFDPKVGLRVPEKCPLGIATDCTDDQEIINKLNWVLGKE